MTQHQLLHYLNGLPWWHKRRYDNVINRHKPCPSDFDPFITFVRQFVLSRQPSGFVETSMLSHVTVLKLETVAQTG